MISAILRLLKDYMRLGVFALGLLIGLQVPAFVEQYDHRVNAHLLEAEQNLSGFQFTADRYFDGSIEKLINHYRNSRDPVFNQDANSIESIYNRVNFLQAESLKLQQSSLFKAIHVFTQPAPTLFDETVRHYNYTVPLSPLALIWGVVCALALALLIDSLLGGCVYCVQRLRGKSGQHEH